MDTFLRWGIRLWNDGMSFYVRAEALKLLLHGLSMCAALIVGHCQYILGVMTTHA